MSVRPAPPKRLPRNQWRPVAGRALRYLRPHRTRTILGIVCVLFASGLGLVPALELRSMVDELTRHRGSFSGVLVPIAIALVATALSAGLGVLQTWLTLSVAEDVVAEVRGSLFNHLIAQSIGYFTRRRAGEAMSRILNDAGGIDSMMGPTVMALANSAFTGVAAFGLMLYLNWELTLVAVVLSPVVALCLRFGGNAIFRARRSVQTQFSEVTAYLHEALGISGIQLIKSFAREPEERARFGRLNQTLRDLEVRAGMATQWFVVAMRLLQVGAPAFLLLAGGYLVVHHDLSLGGLLAFSYVAFNFGVALQSTATGLLTAIGALALWQRIFEVLDQEPELRESPNARVLTDARGEIRLEGVTFSHPGQGRPALCDVSIEIRPGELTALVGPSGAGKTTLSHLVPRFFDPQRGRVLLDGNDVRELTFESLGTAIGLVLQDTYLVHASLRENLSYGRLDANDDALLAAADQANLTDVLRLLPEGLDTVVGERGHRLSGGEKQRVAIARAILKDPPVLILDEATSHLDSVSEQLVQAALSRLLGGRTSLVIAHRLSTILAADQIIVLDRGEVVQRGTHAELVDEPGLYRRLYLTQFASHAAAADDASLPA